MKVAFYGRYSSNNQTEQSIEGQLHVCEQYAQMNGMEIVSQYIDRAMTGKNDKRPEFQRMIADSSKGGFEGVLVYKLDRLARNSYHAAIYKQKLKENGVRIISATENIPDTPEGRLLEGVIVAMNELYSEDLSQKVNRGLAESFHKGYYLKRIPPFGYKLVARKLAPDEDTAPIAAEIFTRYKSGQRLVDIANWLNRLGMTNQKGNPWTIDNISTHLHNRIYMGEYRYGQFTEPMPCAALISPELFDEVQEKLNDSARRSRKRTDYSFMLTGKLKCAYCGHAVSGSTAHGTNHYYYCRHCKKENRHCIPADFLHEKVLHALEEYLTADKVEELAAAAYAVYEQEQSADTRPALKRELAAVETKIKNAVDAILNGADSRILSATLNELEERRDTLIRAINEAPAPLPRLTLRDFVFLLGRMAQLQGKELLDSLVDRIIMRDDRVIICINLTNETNEPPLEQVLFKLDAPEVPPTINNLVCECGWILIAA